MIDAGIILSYGLAGISAIVWAARQEGRVSVLFSRQDDIKERLERIESKLDKLTENWIK